MSHVEFLLDENVLGLARFLENRVKYRKVGGDGCPIKEAEDPAVVKFAKDNGMVIVTRDIKMIEQCEFEGVNYVTLNDIDFAKKITRYPNSD